jgi:hypothetical protein
VTLPVQEGKTALLFAHAPVPTGEETIQEGDEESTIWASQSTHLDPPMSFECGVMAVAMEMVWELATPLSA